MGSGASAETARQTVNSITNGKPADASDIMVKNNYSVNLKSSPKPDNLQFYSSLSSGS
jgi:hypothetical protein